jgi:hypothetical protein
MLLQLIPPKIHVFEAGSLRIDYLVEVTIDLHRKRGILREEALFLGGCRRIKTRRRCSFGDHKMRKAIGCYGIDNERSGSGIFVHAQK